MKALEIKESYTAVLQDIATTNIEVEQIRPSVKLVFSRNVLDEMVEKLDNNAERLSDLDNALSKITPGNGKVDSNLLISTSYPALFDLGNSVYLALYQGYQNIHRLRHRLNLYISLALLTIIGGIGALSFLA